MDVHVLRGGRIVPIAGGEPWAYVLDDNPLHAAGWHPSGDRSCVRIVAWSGRLTDSIAGEAAAPRTWGSAGRAALDALCDRLAPGLAAAGRTLLFRPRAGDVLSDMPSCAAFLRARSGGPFALLLDPAAMLTPDMLPRAEDHLARMFAALTGHPSVAGVVLMNTRRTGGGLEPAPLTVGALAPALIVGAWRAAGARTPVVIADDQTEDQLALLAPR